MSQKNLILRIYKTKLQICKKNGYQLGNWFNISCRNNINRIIYRCNKLKNDNQKSTFLINVIRNKYKKNKKLNNQKMIDYYIDQGFYAIRLLNQFFCKDIYVDEEYELE